MADALRQLLETLVEEWATTPGLLKEQLSAPFQFAMDEAARTADMPPPHLANSIPGNQAPEGEHRFEIVGVGHIDTKFGNAVRIVLRVVEHASHYGTQASLVVNANMSLRSKLYQLCGAAGIIFKMGQDAVDLDELLGRQIFGVVKQVEVANSSGSGATTFSNVVSWRSCT